jgi:chromosome partitioning protein
MAVASQKGGVGKTTTAINLGAYLAAAGEQVLVIDLDSQGNATSSLSVRAPGETPPLRALWDGSTWQELAQETAIPGLQVFPSVLTSSPPIQTSDLRTARQAELRETLAGGGWTWVILDCPPSIGVATELALSWADSVLVPVQCEYLAMEGLAQMLELIGRSGRTRQRPPGLAGILLTLFSAEHQLSVDVVEEVRKYFPDHVLATIVPRDITLAEAASHGKPISLYAPRSRGAWAYLSAAKEILAHEPAQAR